MKLVPALVGATAAIMAEALALGENGGLPGQSIMRSSKSAVASPLLAYKTATIVADDFTPVLVDQDDQGLHPDHRCRKCAAHDAPQHVTALILQQYRDAAAAGLPRDDFFCFGEMAEAWRSLRRIRHRSPRQRSN
jgi:3-hydroxyisobutyrate dehydrogenase